MVVPTDEGLPPRPGGFSDAYTNYKLLGH